MSQPTSFIDCRGLSAPLTVLRIKQAVVGRRDCGLPLDVLVDRACCRPNRISASLTGESTDVRLLYFADTPGSTGSDTRPQATPEIRHV